MVADNIQRFHDDLAATVMAKVPLDISDFAHSPRDFLTLARINQLREKLTATSRISQSDIHPSSATSSDTSTEIPKRYSAALQVFECTGLMKPVLDGFSIRPLAHNESTRALRWTWRYLALVITAAYLGLYLFATTVIPIIGDLRADSQLSISQTQQLSPESYFPSWISLLPVIGVVLLSLLFWGMFGGTKKWSRWLRGNNYTQMRLKQNALETIQLLLAVDLPIESAIEISCSLIGMETNTQAQLKRLWTQDVQPHSTKAEQLQYVADRLLNNMKFRTPIVVVASVGGLIGLLYAVLIFQPVTEMLLEIGSMRI